MYDKILQKGSVVLDHFPTENRSLLGFPKNLGGLSPPTLTSRTARAVHVERVAVWDIAIAHNHKVAGSSPTDNLIQALVFFTRLLLPFA